MPDLSTTYMGLNLRTPLVVSANPLYAYFFSEILGFGESNTKGF